MEINIRQIEDVQANVVDLKGDLDLYEAPELKSKLKKLIESGVKKIVINMRELRYIDSSGIGSLISGLQQMFKAGGKLRLANLPMDVRRSFELANLIKLFDIHSTDDEALKGI